MEGNIQQTMQNGTVFEGKFQQNKKFGVGKFKWPDGTSYEGEIRDECLNGNGTMIYTNGKRY